MKKYMGILLGVTVVAVITITAGCSKKEPTPQPTPPAAESVPAAKVEPTQPAPAAPVQPAQPAEPAAPAGKAQLGQPAAKLDGLTWIKGEPVTFQSGKIYVVEFWATWCPPCKASIPHLTEIQKKYKDKGVTVIGISNEADALEKVKSFVAEKGDTMDYTVAVDVSRTVNDAYMKAYEQGGIPTAFIVDGKGNIVWYGHPMSDLDEVLSQVTAGTFDMTAYAKAKAEREATMRQLQASLREYVAALTEGKPVEETRPLAEKLLEIAPADALNQIAWYVLDTLKEENRDYPTALKLAEKANTLTEGKQPAVLDTYALALFKNNKIAEAIAAQTKAVELAAENKQMQAELQTRLDEFKAALTK
ncbi:MAG: redoxin domain-containing protein [Anaerohalosphaeraceae bacterium]